MNTLKLDQPIIDTRKNLKRITDKLTRSGIDFQDFITFVQSDTPRKVVLLIGGNQISGSLSPFIHNYSARDNSIPLNYVLLNLEEAPYSITEILEYIEKSENILGANITMPYKIEVYNELKKAGKLDTSAIIAGSVNTLYKDNEGQLRGMNTDIDGIVNPIAPSIMKYGIDNAVILGGGGASRAVIIGLLQLGIRKISIYNRSLENIDSFIKTIQDHGDILNISEGFNINTHEYDVTNDILADVSIDKKSILINTLPFGFKENLPKIPIRESILSKYSEKIKIIFDIAYSLEQIDTPLLQYIKTNYPDIETYDGIDMLVEQAKKGFTAWTHGGNINAVVMKIILKNTITIY
ncbi:hypothetical protein KBD33_00385 [Candidatus Gracilibacteria bacterium]|nr:hypothetical protein [Candidatus Gracilibacteria bacterium]